MSLSPFHQCALALFIWTHWRWNSCTIGVVLSRTAIIRCACVRICAFVCSWLPSAAAFSMSSGMEPQSM